MSEIGPNKAELKPKEPEEKTYYDISNNVPASVRSNRNRGYPISVAPFPQIYGTSSNGNPNFRPDVSIRPSFQTYPNIHPSYYTSPQSIPNFQQPFNLSLDCQAYQTPNLYTSSCHPSTSTHSPQWNPLQQQQFENATLHRETMPLLFNGSTNYLTTQNGGAYVPPESNQNAWHAPDYTYYSRGYNNSWRPPPNVNPWGNCQGSAYGNGVPLMSYPHCSTTSNPAYYLGHGHAQYATIPHSKSRYVRGSAQNYAKQMRPNVSNTNENTFTVSLPGGQALFSVPLQIASSSVTSSSPPNSFEAMNVPGSSTQNYRVRPTLQQNKNVRSASIGKKVQPDNSYILNVTNSGMQNDNVEDFSDNLTYDEGKAKSSSQVITIDSPVMIETPQMSLGKPRYPNGATEELTRQNVNDHESVLYDVSSHHENESNQDLQTNKTGIGNTNLSSASLQNTSKVSLRVENFGAGNLESQEAKTYFTVTKANASDLHGETISTPFQKATPEAACVAKTASVLTERNETSSTVLSSHQNGLVLDMPNIFDLLTPDKNISKAKNPTIQVEELFEDSMSLLGDLQQDLCMSESDNEAENEDAAGAVTVNSNATNTNIMQSQESVEHIPKSMDNESINCQIIDAGTGLEMGTDSNLTTTEVHLSIQYSQQNENSKSPIMNDEDMPIPTELNVEVHGKEASTLALPIANSPLLFQAPSPVLSISSEEGELVVDETISEANDLNSSMQNENSKSEDENVILPSSVGLPSFNPCELISRLLRVSKSDSSLQPPFPTTATTSRVCYENEEREMRTRRSIFSPDMPISTREQDQAIPNPGKNGLKNDLATAGNEITFHKPTSSSAIIITSGSDLIPNSAKMTNSNHTVQPLNQTTHRIPSNCYDKEEMLTMRSIFSPDLRSNPRDHVIPNKSNHDDLNYVSLTRNAIILNQNASLDDDANNVDDEEMCNIHRSPPVPDENLQQISYRYNDDNWNCGLEILSGAAHYQAIIDTRQVKEDHSFRFSNSNNSHNAEASASPRMDLRMNRNPFSGLNTLADVALGTGIAHNLTMMTRKVNEPDMDTPLDLTIPKQSYNFRPLQNPNEANFINRSTNHIWQSAPPTEHNSIACYNKGLQPHANTTSNYHRQEHGCLPPLNGNGIHANLSKKSIFTPYSKSVSAFVKTDHSKNETIQVPNPASTHAQAVGLPVPLPLDTGSKPIQTITAATNMNMNTPQLKPSQFTSRNSKVRNDSSSLPKTINENVDLKTRYRNKRSSTPNTSHDYPQTHQPNRMSVRDETGKRVVKRIARASKPILSNSASSNLLTVQSIQANFKPLLDHAPRSNTSNSNAYKQRSKSGKLFRRLIDRYRKPATMQSGRVRKKYQRELNQVFKLGTDNGTTPKSMPTSRRTYNNRVQELMIIPQGPFERRLKGVRQNSTELNNAVPRHKKINTTN